MKIRGIRCAWSITFVLVACGGWSVESQHVRTAEGEAKEAAEPSLAMLRSACDGGDARACYDLGVRYRERGYPAINEKRTVDQAKTEQDDAKQQTQEQCDDVLHSTTSSSSNTGSSSRSS